jgi:hypothetical protein
MGRKRREMFVNGGWGFIGWVRGLQKKCMNEKQ